MYHYFFIHSFVNVHLGCFHVLAIVNTVLDEHWGICVLFFQNYGFIRVWRKVWSILKKKKNWKSNDLKIN